MKNRIDKLNELQNKAVNSFKESNYIGTLLMSMRTGKTFCFFKSLYLAVEDNILSFGDHIIFYAETTARKITLQEEIEKFKKIYSKEVDKDFKIEFRCYQSGIKKADGYCFDEVDLATSPKFSKVLLQDANFKLGLTGTISAQKTVFKSKVDEDMVDIVRQSDKDTNNKIITSNINKQQMLDVTLPVCFYYPVWKAVKDNIVSPIKTTIIKNTLDDSKLYVQLNKQQNFKQTELKAYLYADKRSKEWYGNKHIAISYGRKKAAILHNLKSKVTVTKNLLKTLKGNTLIYGVRKEILKLITPNVCESHNTKELLESLKNGDITTLGSCKMISRGNTVGKYIDNIIFVSYYKESTDFIQKLFRASTKDEGKFTNIYLFVTHNTLEEKWSEEMLQIKDYKGNIIHNLDLNVKEIIDLKL